MLYHYQVGIPRHIRLPRCVVALKYSNHALRECKRDRVAYDELPVLNTIDLGLCQVIEVEVNHGTIDKWVIRLPIDGRDDLVLAVVPMGPDLRWYVKTCWSNAASDSHLTLDRSKYDAPVEQEFFFV